VIVRRHAETDDPALIPVGLPLPPAAGKRRIALLLPPDGVLQRSSPLLRAAARVADSGWRSTIASLLALGTRIGVELSAFGSLLWQHLTTRLTYLSPHSDLDLLWPVPAGFDVLSLVFSIAEIQRDAPLRIDGEVVFPNGSAVNWRELWMARCAGDRPSVLVKTMEDVRPLDIDLCRALGSTHECSAATCNTVRAPGATAATRRRCRADRRSGRSRATA
jgi:phosphoribosyl-dephospho-CoA transferase